MKGILTLFVWALSASFAIAGSCTNGACTLDTGQTTVLPSGIYRYLDIKNQDSSITISCNFIGGSAIVGGAGSFDIAAGWHRSFPDAGTPQYSYVPQGPVICTAASGTPNVTLNFTH